MPTRWTTRSLLQTIAIIVFILAVNNAIPFVTMPTMGQAVWILGFSQSFANQSLLAIHALNFGAPYPAAISFGLSGAYPISLLLRAGIPAADAYTIVVAAWLIVAYVGASRISRHFGLSENGARLSAVLWLTLPIVWMHAGYSMLSLGIALLPWYFYSTIRLIDASADSARRFPLREAVAFFGVAIVSIFMDGYTFVMFALSSSILLALGVARSRENRPALIVRGFPVMVLAYVFSYELYILYIGHTQFGSDPIETFRAWGVDLSFMMIPTWGIQWLPDLLHLETKRRLELNFGDASVWTTSFCLPLIALALAGLSKRMFSSTRVLAFLAIALFGTYMALGPSVKFFSARNPQDSSQPFTYSMPSSAAIAPTGNAAISRHVPGLRNMRASYRWLAMASLGYWLLVVLCLSNNKSIRRYRFFCVAMGLVIAFNLPHTLKLLNDGFEYRMLFNDMDKTFAADLARAVPPGSTVAFLPFSNDFLANYLASRARIRTFNIGGDKNLAEAMQHWPEYMRGFQQSVIDADFNMRIKTQLVSGEADAVIIPYVDLLWGAHFWPCASLMQQRGSSYIHSEVKTIDQACPEAHQRSVAATLRSLADEQHLKVEGHEYFAKITLPRESDMPRASSQAAYPAAIGSENKKSQELLVAGWLPPEPGLVWSGSRAWLDVPLDDFCLGTACHISLKFGVLGASATRNVKVYFSDAKTGHALSCITTNAEGTLQAQLDAQGHHAYIKVTVPNAASPQQLGISADPRVLGMALLEVDVTPGPAQTSGGGCLPETSAQVPH